MEIDGLKIKKNFCKTGFFKIENVVKKSLVNELIQEINDSRDTIKYFDNDGVLRRVEKIYDKGKQLKNLKEIIKKCI